MYEIAEDNGAGSMETTAHTAINISLVEDLNSHQLYHSSTLSPNNQPQRVQRWHKEHSEEGASS